MTLVVPYLCPIPIGPGSTGLFGIGLRRMVEPLMLKETQGHIMTMSAALLSLEGGEGMGWPHRLHRAEMGRIVAS